MSKRLNLYVGLYGRLIKSPVMYCDLHKCFLTKEDVKRRKCDEKECYARRVKSKWW